MKGKSKASCIIDNYFSFANSIPLCLFNTFAFGAPNIGEVTGMVAAATGWQDFDLAEELVIGERNYNLARAFTIRESDGKVDDRLPFKLSKPSSGGMSQGQSISKTELKEALAEYYPARGWNARGAPTREKLKELGLADVADQLHGKGGAK
jgi:aldehyde:ferredoxin oxidoreductase